MQLIAGLRTLVAILERLEVPYFVCGSVASSLHGVPRATMDVDLVAGVKKRHVPALVAALAPEFYADPSQIEEALARNRAFNLIHLGTSYKFDVFPLLEDPWSEAQSTRSSPRNITMPDGNLRVMVASAEDTLLAKLVWYRQGGEISDRQWHDIQGLVTVQGQGLDRDYLENWAEKLRVTDLLRRATATLPRRS